MGVVTKLEGAASHDRIVNSHSLEPDPVAAHIIDTTSEMTAGVHTKAMRFGGVSSESS